MSNLIKLELRKFKIKNNIIAALICNIFILGMICLIFFVERSEGVSSFKDYHEFSMIIATCINSTFIIFAGFLISKFIIEEYKDKTISLLFMYPIKRKKIIISKVIIIAVFTFCFTLISNLIIFPSFYFIQVITNTTLEKLTFEMIQIQLIKSVISAVTNSMVGLIPIYFGLRKKSVPITILSSFLVASILNSNFNGFTLSSFIIIPIIFCIIGITVVYCAIKDIDNKDLNV